MTGTGSGVLGSWVVVVVASVVDSVVGSVVHSVVHSDVHSVVASVVLLGYESTLAARMITTHAFAQTYGTTSTAGTLPAREFIFK